MAEPSVAAQFGLLVRHEANRVAAELRRPRPGVLVAIGLPIVLIGAALAAAGAEALPDPNTPAGAIGLAFLVSAPISFFGYGILFRSRDDGLLRRLGFEPASLYLVRAMRLVMLSFFLVALLLLPFVVDARPLGRTAILLVATAAAACGAALLAFSHAAALTARVGWRPGVFSGLMGLDPELVKVGPLVYAPLAPLAVALGIGGWLGAAPVIPAWAVAVVVAVAVAMAVLALPRFSSAAGRFAPRAQEMAFAPPPEAGEAGLVLDRGVARLLPRRSRAVLARDSRVVERRFRWASSIVWPVAIISVIALARWGDNPTVRTWVIGAGVLTLLVQAVAVIGIGRIEAAGARWIDHAIGLTTRERWVGRGTFGFGLSLWLTLPLALAWGLWAGTGSGWSWIAAGLGSATVAATASVSASRRWR